METIVPKGARLANKPVNHVAIVDVVLALATQPRECFHFLLRVPDFDHIGENPHFHLLANQAAVNGILVALNADQTAATNRYF